MASFGIKMVARQSCQLRLVRGENISSSCLVVSNLKNYLSSLYSIRSMACSASTAKNESKERLVTTIEEAKRFMIDCFKAVNTPQEHAEIVAENLIEADFRGHYSHGMNRLGMYIKDIQGGMCDPQAVCAVDKQNAGTAVVDGRNGLGAVVGKFCMDLAIEKAKNAGIGMVVAHGSNHYGIAGMFALQAIKKGCLGLSFTNTSPFMAPTRAKEAALGTNPISLGAPGLNGDSFVLDMATTAVAVGKIELARRKGQPLPEGWAMNNEGQIETNAEVAMGAGKLMPLGGQEVNSGYKGYGLGMLVEILSGLLAGAAYGPHVRPWGAHGENANLGHGFIAINPESFAPGFEGRLSDLMDYLRNMQPADPSKPVLVQGDPERIHMKQVLEDGGLIYVPNQHESNLKLAKELNVKPMVSKTAKSC